MATCFRAEASYVATVSFPVWAGQAGVRTANQELPLVAIQVVSVLLALRNGKQPQAERRDT